MARIDPEQERRRLFEFYSGQMDGELEQVAAQAYELTDLAREQLRAELARRGLRAELAETAPVPGPGRCLRPATRLQRRLRQQKSMLPMASPNSGTW